MDLFFFFFFEPKIDCKSHGSDQVFNWTIEEVRIFLTEHKFKGDDDGSQYKKLFNNF